MPGGIFNNHQEVFGVDENGILLRVAHVNQHFTRIPRLDRGEISATVSRFVLDVCHVCVNILGTVPRFSLPSNVRQLKDTRHQDHPKPEALPRSTRSWLLTIIQAKLKIASSIPTPHMLSLYQIKLWRGITAYIVDYDVK